MARRWSPWLAVVTPYGIAALLIWAFSSSSIGENLNLLLYDTSLQLRPAPSGHDSPIKLVGISEADIRRFGWPVNDLILTEAVQQLSKAGAKAIGLDIYRDKGIDPGSLALRKELQQNRRLIAIFNQAESIPPPPGTPAKQQAFNDLVLDGDGVLRRDLVHVEGQPASIIALPLRLLEVAQGSDQLQKQFPAAWLQSQWLHPYSGGYQQVDSSGRQRLLPYRQPGSFRQWSLGELIDGQIPPAQLNGAIVLIGSTAASLRDNFNTPFTRFSGTARLATMPGVEVHAQRLAALLDLKPNGGFRTSVLPDWNRLVVLLLTAALGIGIGEGAKAMRRSGLLLIVSELLLLGLGFGLLLQGLWVDTSVPMASLAAMTAAGWLRRGAAGQLQRRQIERLLGQTTSPEVAAELWKQRETLLEDGSFPGRQLPVTILFADIVGFSKVAERLAPAETLHWVNGGMTQFLEVIHRHGGMINKFTGDGFLAVFGVPLLQDSRQTATQAMRTAAELQVKVLQLNQQLAQNQQPPLHLRLGLHSGEVITGSMGSSERMEYTVIGDVVNVSARLEALHKERMNNLCRVLLSAETLQLLNNPEQWQFLSWGAFPLKGRDQTIEVYELQSC
ncbi:CHASE2 domain-containing protein [Cyanobium sp. HWJ4-Hawea]|uniref:CHASE2 domain-containing protein n=1 Tax=Cyanobium sp. HWJ4-Hawea TaxID=2823713 RepID=UPI0020CD43B9|nr:adenylate/guanylate cyclase domain-containing protein [Cyanobium sp. HWJ4-Hawea]MCP9808173.1 CHASE2 domain-containing protein [Cyanobium sp. HWJ4-Hawea]